MDSGVEIRHENPYLDDSYAVNSANLGPYGDAITQELIPYIDASFRTIPERGARTLTGGSTGGWEAFAQMVFYPDTYAGTWALRPDPSTSASTNWSTSTRTKTPTSTSTNG